MTSSARWLTTSARWLTSSSRWSNIWFKTAEFKNDN